MTVQEKAFDSAVLFYAEAQEIIAKTAPPVTLNELKKAAQAICKAYGSTASFEMVEKSDGIIVKNVFVGKEGTPAAGHYDAGISFMPVEGDKSHLVGLQELTSLLTFARYRSIDEESYSTVSIYCGLDTFIKDVQTEMIQRMIGRGC